MKESGLFITLNNKETLDLYVTEGVYGELRPPELKEIKGQSMHYAALADAACARQGDHVFFFLERSIVYGGQIIGSKYHGSYIINGPYSPLGRKVGAEVYWDESIRGVYPATDHKGIFKINNEDRCQPYLITFEDKLGMKGYAIESDVLYAELSLRYRHPVPSNGIQGKSFCTITPGETQLLLELLGQSSNSIIDKPKDQVHLASDPLFFDPSMSISHLSDAKSKYHHDAMLLSNPELLPAELRPNDSAICRKVPMSPFKPAHMDQADLCYYGEDEVLNGTLPNIIIEMDWKRSDSSKMFKLVKYIEWLKKLIPDQYEKIQYNFFAPSFVDTVRREIPDEYRSIIKLISYRA